MPVSRILLKKTNKPKRFSADNPSLNKSTLLSTSGTWGWCPQTNPEVFTPAGHWHLEFIYFLLEIFEYGVHSLRRAPDPLKCLTFPLVGLLQGGPVNVPHQRFGLAQHLQCCQQHHHENKIIWREQNKGEKEKKAYDLWMWMHCEFFNRS